MAERCDRRETSHPGQRQNTHSQQRHTRLRGEHWSMSRKDKGLKEWSGYRPLQTIIHFKTRNEEETRHRFQRDRHAHGTKTRLQEWRRYPNRKCTYCTSEKLQACFSCRRKRTRPRLHPRKNTAIRHLQPF